MPYLTPTPPRFSCSTSVRILLLLGLALAGLLLASAATLVLGLTTDGTGHTSTIYTSLLLQDVVVFIVPAIAAMAICFHQPLRLMGLLRAPSWGGLGMALLVCVLSLPMMNWVVEWNKGLHLPASLSGLEQAIRQAEAQAEALTGQMMSGTGVGSLLANLLMVGVMAGVSEECFFRGGLQQLLAAGRWNKHAAVWITAFVFSAIHLQFLGFVPRLLLGAWLGYLLVGTGSLWVPIFAHTLNNSLVVLATWLEHRGAVDTGSLDAVGLAPAGQVPWLAIASAVATVAVIVAWMRRKPATDGLSNRL